MMPENSTINAVAEGPPEVSADALAAAVQTQFGLAGDYRLLVSERDLNFRLRTAAGDRFVVKVANRAEDPVFTDFQIGALKHVQAAGINFVPEVVPTVSGDERGSVACKDGGTAVLRLVTWLQGRLLNSVGTTPPLASLFGQRLAELDLALASYTHPGEQQLLLWDIQRALELRGLLHHVDDVAVRQRVAEVLQAFEDRVMPVLASLPQQVIHNDANPENILLDEAGQVSGIIDFGDMMREPRIVEVCNAAAYLRNLDGDPLLLIAPFLASYHKYNPLLREEVSLSYDLIRTRLAMTVVVLYWRLSVREPGDPYRKKNLAEEATAFDFLECFSALGRDSVTACLLDLSRL